MKFSRLLQFNAVPEWADGYINYAGLKRTVYELQQQVLDQSGLLTAEASKESPEEEPAADAKRFRLPKWGKRGLTEMTEDVESSALLELFDPVRIFTAKLDAEAAKVDEFYAAKEKEIFAEAETLQALLTHRGRAGLTDAEDGQPLSVAPYLAEQPEGSSGQKPTSRRGSVASRVHTRQSLFSGKTNEEDGSDVELDDMLAANTALIHHSEFTVEAQEQIRIKRKLTLLFVLLSLLKQFVELNKLGFTKICKKFDKVLQQQIRVAYVQGLSTSYTTFSDDTLAQIDARISDTVKEYARWVYGAPGETVRARAELRLLLREHIVWERNTVWKDMLGLEKTRHDIDGQQHKVGDAFTHSGKIAMTTLWKIPVPQFLLQWRVFNILLAVVVTVILISIDTFHDQQAHNCMAMLACVAILWATEAIPLYITLMLVPFLTVAFKVLKDDDGNQMQGAAAATKILSTMWNSVIMVLIGGFTLAAALSKYNVARVMSLYILAIAGTNPRNLLLAIMVVAVFLAMWISNVASPVLCFSLIQPVLRTIDTDLDLAKALILGIALALNVAGMTSPILSPQNIVAIQYMLPNPGWGNWFAVALPVGVILTVLIWLLLCVMYPKMQQTKLMAYKPIKEKFTWQQWYICIVTVATILMWCFMSNHHLTAAFGELGIVSVFALVMLFGAGLLNTNDINLYPWLIVLLAMGGLALGSAVTSSGLLSIVAHALQRRVEDYNAITVLAIFGIVVLAVATFVLHTVAAMIIVPLVKEVGDQLPHPHPNLLIMGTAFMASGAMALPTSGFPNVTAILMVDEVGKRYLTVKEFITRGLPASLICYVVVITVGYGIMSALGY